MTFLKQVQVQTHSGPSQCLTRCATVCLECSPNTTSGRPSQRSWRPANPSCLQRTKQVFSCSGCLSKQADRQGWASHTAGWGGISHICCKAALNLHLRGWEECLVPLWQQPSSVCHCCQRRIWGRGSPCEGRGKLWSWENAFNVAFNERLISFILVIMLP